MFPQNLIKQGQKQKQRVIQIPDIYNPTPYIQPPWGTTQKIPKDKIKIPATYIGQSSVGVPSYPMTVGTFDRKKPKRPIKEDKRKRKPKKLYTERQFIIPELQNILLRGQKRK